MGESVYTMELFAGTKSFSKVAEKLGYKTFTVDNNEKLKPDLIIDINEFNINMVPFPRVDYLWVSPPCTTFSVCSISRYWINGKPKNDECLDGINLVKKSISIIKELLVKNPNMIWFIENPRGMLRRQEFIKGLPRKTVTYCKYGGKYQKPTDIWSNHINWIPKKKCKSGDKCHINAPRGKGGTQSLANAKERGRIPEALFYEIFGKQKEKQSKL